MMIGDICVEAGRDQDAFNYFLAAAKEEKHAKLNVAKLYIHGKGVPQNFPAALSCSKN